MELEAPEYTAQAGSIIKAAQNGRLRSNWDFDLTKRNPRRAWIDDELALLSWTCITISQAIRAVTEQDFPRHRSSHFGNLDGSLDMVPKPVRDRLPIIAVGRAGQRL